MGTQTISCQFGSGKLYFLWNLLKAQTVGWESIGMVGDLGQGVGWGVGGLSGNCLGIDAVEVRGRM